MGPLWYAELKEIQSLLGHPLLDHLEAATQKRALREGIPGRRLDHTGSIHACHEASQHLMSNYATRSGQKFMKASIQHELQTRGNGRKKVRLGREVRANSVLTESKETRLPCCVRLTPFLQLTFAVDLD